MRRTAASFRNLRPALFFCAGKNSFPWAPLANIARDKVMLLAVLLAPALQPDAFAAPLDYTEADVRDVRGIYDDSLDGGRGLAESATPPFSSELAIKVAGPKKQLLLSFTNRIRVDFAFTWVAHIRALGLTNFLVGATDDVAVEELTTGKVPCFSMKTNLPQGEWPWGSSSFKALGPHKIELIYKSIQWGLEVVITDIDALVSRVQSHTRCPSIRTPPDPTPPYSVPYPPCFHCGARATAHGDHLPQRYTLFCAQPGRRRPTRQQPLPPRGSTDAGPLPLGQRAPGREEAAPSNASATSEAEHRSVCSDQHSREGTSSAVSRCVAAVFRCIHSSCGPRKARDPPTTRHETASRCCATPSPTWPATPTPASSPPRTTLETPRPAVLEAEYVFM